MRERLKRLVVTFGIVGTMILLESDGKGSASQGASENFELVSTIVFTSTRDTLTLPLFLSGEIYLMSPDGSNPVRLTDNAEGDGLAALSPDGKKVVFDSTRSQTPGEPVNTSDLFVMDSDGSEVRHLIRGSSATWSPDGKFVAFHASASGTGEPIKGDPGAATRDSDIFVINVDDAIAGLAGRINVTNSPEAIDDDPDWSPDGEKLAFTSHFVEDNPINSITAEIYLIRPDGTGLTRLTFNNEEERAPSWSPDGTRIVFMCRRGKPTFEICVMNADGTGQEVQLTDNSVLDGTPTFSPDGQKIVFARNLGAGGGNELFLMNTDGTGQTRLTDTAGLNLFANWGELRVKIPNPKHQ